MSAVFAAFGIDWRLLLIDSINFGILLWALWYFLYAPLTAMLEARRQKVIQGVHDADAAATKLAEIEGEAGHMLAKAGAEADDVLKSVPAPPRMKRARAIVAARARLLQHALMQRGRSAGCRA